MGFLLYKNGFRKYFAEKFSACVSIFGDKSHFLYVSIKLFALCTLDSEIQTQSKTALRSIRQSIHCAYEWDVLVSDRAENTRDNGCLQPSCTVALRLPH